jgi:glycerol-3-phosphate acyltransferase PlsY
MIDLQIALLAAVVGYLLGSISFARVIMGLVAPGETLTGMEVDAGTGEKFEVETVGGTAVSLKLGAKFGMITALLDILKAAFPALVFKLLYPGMPYYLITATTAMIGHNWPIYYRFKGGRGLSPMYGGFLVADWIGTLITAVAGMLLGLVVFRDVVVSYLLGPLLMIPWLWFRTRDPWHLAFAVILNVIFLLAMIPEIKNYREYKRQGIDMAAAMEATPMGHGIKKMANRLGLMRDSG